MLRVLGVVAILLFAGILYVAIIGISFDISSQRDKAAAVLTKNLGRKVIFDGPLQFELSARPKLILGGLHIANAEGFAGSEFASLGEARLALNLWPLLRLRFQVDELSGNDVKIHLQLNKNGRSNWTFNSPSHKPEAAQAPGSNQAATTALENLLTHLDIEHVSLKKLDVEFIASDAKSHFFELQSLVAQFPAGQPLQLALQGTVEKSYPYNLDLKGGDLADLIRLNKPWPIDLTLGLMSSHLSINGNISADTGAIKFDLASNDLSEFERLLQSKLPAVGSARLAGAIKYARGKIVLDSLTGNMGKTTLNGALTFDYSGARPKIQGALALPVLDLRPFMTGKSTAKPCRGVSGNRQCLV
jgi:uncharacterized protein involved in outer membrane biogenesis